MIIDATSESRKTVGRAISIGSAGRPSRIFSVTAARSSRVAGEHRLRQGRPRERGHDGVDADGVRRPLRSQGPRDVVHRRLRATVGRTAGRADTSRLGRDVDDRAASRIGVRHLARDAHGHEVGPFEVDTDEVVELRFIEVDRSRRDVVACVVDEAVDAAVPRDGTPDELIDGLDGAHVEDRRRAHAPIRLDLVPQRIELSDGAAPCDDDAAGAVDGDRDRSTDAPARPGDHDDATVEPERVGRSRRGGIGHRLGAISSP